MDNLPVSAGIVSEDCRRITDDCLQSIHPDNPAIASLVDGNCSHVAVDITNVDGGRSHWLASFASKGRAEPLPHIIVDRILETIATMRSVFH